MQITGVCCAVFAALLSLPAGAAADIDVTGSWTIERSDPYTMETYQYPIDLSQSGSSLAWGSGMDGTIDPVTGEFAVSGTRMIGPYTAPISGEGTVEPDGNRLEGSATDWTVFASFPTQYTYPFRAIRDGVSVCGDDVREADEACDYGAINGLQDCCSASCELIDPDEDRLCSEFDPCPDLAYAPASACGGTDPFSVSTIRARFPNSTPGEGTLKFKAVITGQEIHLVDSIETLRLTDSSLPANYDLVVGDFTCTRLSEKRLDCASADGTKTISVRLRSDGAKLKVMLRSSPLLGDNFDSPFLITLTDEYGFVRSTTGTL